MIKNKNDVIILAAGNSQRFRDKQKKQNKKISNQSLVDIAIRYFVNRKEINNIFVTYNKKIHGHKSDKFSSEPREAYNEALFEQFKQFILFQKMIKEK